MPELVSRSEFARMLGVSPAAITKATKGALSPACVADRIDAEHPAAVAYASNHLPETESKQGPMQRQSRRGRPSKNATKPTRKKVADGEIDPENIDTFGHLTVFEVVAHWGTTRNLLDWVDALKKVTEIRRLRIANAEKEGKLIQRETVTAHIFGLIDATNRNLLGETSRTIVQRLYAAAKNGTPPEESERVVRDLISAELSRVVTNARKALRDDG